MRILIADDHALFREGLKNFLEDIDPKIELFQSADYAQTIEILNKEKTIDLVIVDLDMPDMGWEDGLNLLVKNLEKDTKFLIISASEDVKTVKKCLELGARGYIPKRTDPKILESAIRIVMDDGIYLPSDILHKYLISNPDKSHKEKSKLLTERQEQVLRLAASGLSNKQIAYELGVVESTVKLHINSLLRAFGAKNRTQAIMFAQKEGLI
ncbi:MAG: response regulator transcription factor [Lactobacillaceae bacterium]|jgi:DNA-binding NarL/FixJ family response regulator|nr:response regulator transcription factor [Lactobacillaceae bacterium]